MKYLATLIALTFFLFVPNSVAFNKDRHDERLPELYELLKKGDVREKRVALQMLWFLGRPEYRKDRNLFDPILKLLNDKSPKVREAAVAKFKRLAGGYKSSFYKCDIAKNAIVPELMKALSDKAPLVRLEAAKALGYYQDTRAVKPLILLLQDHNLWVRYEAIHALGKINPRVEAVVPLMNIIAVDDIWPTKLLQQEALKTLAFSLQQSAATVRKKKAKERYFKNGITVRKTLIDPRIRGKVIFILLKKSNDPYLKADVIKLLDAMHIQIREDRAERVLKYLIASAGDNKAQIRKLALSSLFSITYLCAQIDDKTDRNGTIQRYRSIVTDLCIAALKDPSVEVRKKAADLLGKSEDPKAVLPLIKALNDENSDMKVAAIKALGHFNDPMIIDPLLDTLSDESKTVRISAIDELGHYNDLKVLDALPPHFGSLKKSDDNASVSRVFAKIVRATKEGIRLVYLYNGKRNVRKIDNTTPAILPRNIDTDAVKMLLNHPRAVESILQTLKDPNFNGHLHALKSLRQFEDERIGNNIISFLDNPSPAVRKAALSLVYWSIDPDKAMTIIKGALNDKDAKVQKEARKLLNALEATYVKHDDKVEENIDALKSRDAPTRLKAVNALMKIMDKKAVVPLITCLDDADHRVRRDAATALW